MPQGIRDIITSISRQNLQDTPSAAGFARQRNEQTVDAARTALAARAAVSGLTIPELQRREAENAQRQIDATRQAQVDSSAETASKLSLDEQRVATSRILANTAATKAKGTTIGGEGLTALGFSPEDVNKFSGKISPPTARTGAQLKERRAALKDSEKTLQFRKEKEVNDQRENNRKSIRATNRDAIAKTRIQLGAIDKQLGSVNPEEIKKARGLVQSLLAEQEGGGVPLPEDQVEVYRASATKELPEGATAAEIDALALELAKKDGFSFLE